MIKTNLFIKTELPEFLTQEEINIYFKNFLSGDLSAREIIINRSIGIIVYRVFERFYNYSYDKNDLFSVGLIGLIKSVDTYDITKKIPFSFYASKCIDNEILMFMRKEKKHIYDISLDEPITTYTNCDIIYLKDTIFDINDDLELDYEKKELYFFIRKFVSHLPKTYKEIAILYFGFDNKQPLNQVEIAAKLNVTQSHISRCLKTIEERIAFQLKIRGLIETTTKIKKRNFKK